ncbi:MAG: ABC transporter permease, partial [bacterium]
MSVIDAMRFRISLLTNRGEHERDDAEEIEFHLRLDAEQHADDARASQQAARRRFGNVTYYREELRRMGGHWLFDELVQDVRFALRSFRRTPTFTIITVMTLAVGIGANTAIFSAVDALLLRPLPFREPHRLMNVSIAAPAVGSRPARDDMLWSYKKFGVLREQQKVFDDLTLWASSQFTVNAGREAQRESGEFVDAHYFPILGIEPALGRAFLVEEDRVGGSHVLVIGYALWQRVYGADSAVIGKFMDVDGTPFRIVGVAPPAFTGLSGNASVWVPTTAPPTAWDNLLASDPYYHMLHAIGRLKPGVSFRDAAIAVRDLGARVDAVYPVKGARDIHMSAVANELNGLRVDARVRRTILILFGAVGLVLLTACANVANLFLVRASSRRREIATRLAIGASRVRIVRQLLVESVLISLVGGIASIIIAWSGVRILGAIQLATMLRMDELGGLGAVAVQPIVLDSKALAFATVLAIGTGIVFGLFPALYATRSSLGRAIRGDTRRQGAAQAVPGRGALVLGEIALAVVLLAGSGLMIRTLAHLLAVRPGFDSRNVLTLRVNRAPTWARDSITKFYDVAIRRLGEIPGVNAVAMSDCPPLGGCAGTDVRLSDRPAFSLGRAPIVGLHWVTPGWFALLRIPVLRGRGFRADDNLHTERVVLMSESAAQRLWPGQNPIGRIIGLGVNDFGLARVVGIVGDVHFETVASPPRPEVYLSYYQAPLSFRMMLFVRTDADPNGSLPAIRDALHTVAPGFPIYDVLTMAVRERSSMAYAQFSAIVLTLFAAMALVLAAIGTYGVMSFVVVQRTRELGLRAALGATHRATVRMVVGQGMRLASLGIVIGLMITLIMSRVLESMLVDVEPTDPLTLALIVSVLMATMFAASW